MSTRTALITGASRGLGRALTTALNDRGWRLVVDGRDSARLTETAAGLPDPSSSRPSPGTSPTQRTGRHWPRPPAHGSTSS